MIQCSKCKQTKDESQFYPNPRKIRGFTYWCKDCLKELREKNRISHKNYMREYRRDNHEKVLETQKKSYQAVKLEIFLHYAKGKKPMCECCGEDHFEFLTIDHIEGRKKWNHKPNWSGFYYWLKRNNYPEGFRILCMNCNFSLGKFGYCPHKK